MTERIFPELTDFEVGRIQGHLEATASEIDHDLERLDQSQRIDSTVLNLEFTI